MQGAENRFILLYHGISPTWPAETSVHPDKLREQLVLLQSKGYEGATLSAALEAPPSSRTMVVTFDDAHRSVYEVARPILAELGVPGTIFVPTDYPDSGRLMAWDGYDTWLGTQYEPELECMSWAQLREVADDGWEIGSHSCSHPLLTELSDAELQHELVASRAACEERLERPCRSLAYPYSDWDARVAAAAGASGFTSAVTVNTGPWSERLALPRTAVNHYDTASRLRIRVTRRRFRRIDALLKRLKGIDPTNPRT